MNGYKILEDLENLKEFIPEDLTLVQMTILLQFGNWMLSYSQYLFPLFPLIYHERFLVAFPKLQFLCSLGKRITTIKPNCRLECRNAGKDKRNDAIP